MLSILKQYTDGEYQVTEYTEDGKTVSHIVKTPIHTEQANTIEPQPTLGDKVNYLYYKSKGVI